MAVLPPVVMEIKADATQFHEVVTEAKKAAASFQPSDYQIRLDALKLTVQIIASRPDITPAEMSEWQEMIEHSLRHTEAKD